MPEHKKILIVDDSKVSRMLIRNFIQARRPNWESTEAADGEEALQLALNTVFDYATVDINMPGMDGLELTTRFREECPQLRVCLLSANFQDDSRRRALALNVGFVKKPITEQGIAESIAYFESPQ